MDSQKVLNGSKQVNIFISNHLVQKATIFQGIVSVWTPTAGARGSGTQSGRSGVYTDLQPCLPRRKGNGGAQGLESGFVTCRGLWQIA